MDMIVAVDRNWGIGKNGNLLTRIPNDMKRFKAITTGNAIVFGRKTLDTFPKGEALSGRTNIVLTTDKNFCKDNIIVCGSIDELLMRIKEYESVFVVGGESVYKQLLEYCHRVYVTKIDEIFEADTYFENLDEYKFWQITEESVYEEYNGLRYKYVTYERKMGMDK